LPAGTADEDECEEPWLHAVAWCNAMASANRADRG